MNRYYNYWNPQNNGFRANQPIARDYGPYPLVINIHNETLKNNNFRTSLWTGYHLQLTLMSIPTKGDVGLEMHPNLDQFLRIEEGEALVQMGDRKDNLYITQKANNDYAVIVPAGTWHNLTNIGNRPLKLYSIYAPPNHPWGTIQATQAIAEAEEHG